MMHLVATICWWLRNTIEFQILYSVDQTTTYKLNVQQIANFFSFQFFY